MRWLGLAAALVALGLCLIGPAATHQDAQIGSITLTAPRRHHPHHHRHCRRHHHHRRCRRHTHRLRPAPVVPLWGAPQPPGIYPPPFDFGDPSGSFTFNCGTDGSVGATINLCRGGTVAGVYLDDTTSDLPYWVKQAAAKYALVIVGQAPNGPCAATGTAICAREFYPFDCRFPPGAWGPIPPARAYIVQWRFAWPGCGPPTPAERSSLLADVEALRPLYVFLY